MDKKNRKNNLYMQKQTTGQSLHSDKREVELGMGSDSDEVKPKPK